MSLLAGMLAFVFLPMNVQAYDSAEYGNNECIAFDFGYIPFRPGEETVVYIDNLKAVIIDDIYIYSNLIMRQFPIQWLSRTTRLYCLCWYCRFAQPRTFVGTVTTTAQAMSNGTTVQVFTTGGSIEALTRWNLRMTNSERCVSNV